jgi:hypothetical protein
MVIDTKSNQSNQINLIRVGPKRYKPLLFEVSSSRCEVVEVTPPSNLGHVVQLIQHFSDIDALD